MSNNKMTKSDASRIQAATAKQQPNGAVPKGSFAARAQATADKAAPKNK